VERRAARPWLALPHRPRAARRQDARHLVVVAHDGSRPPHALALLLVGQLLAPHSNLQQRLPPRH